MAVECLRCYDRPARSVKPPKNREAWDEYFAAGSIARGRGAASGGQRFWICRCADQSRPDRHRRPANPFYAWQWRTSAVVDDDAVADGIQRYSPGAHVRDQFY